MTNRNLTFLKAEAAKLTQLLADLPATRRLARASLLRRLEEVREALTKERSGSAVAEHHAVVDVAIVGGESVHGSTGADAEVAGTMLAAYARAVRTHSESRVRRHNAALLNKNGRRRRGAPADRPTLRAYRPFVIGSVHKSFGFRLVHEDLDTGEVTGSQEPTVVDDQAITLVSEVIFATCDADEEKAADALGSMDRGTAAAIKDLLKIVAAAGAGFKVLVNKDERELPSADIKRVAERLDQSDITESERELAGVLRGIVTAQRVFEFRPDGTDIEDATITGKIDGALDRQDLELWQNRTNEKSIASFMVTTITKKGKVRDVWRLVGLRRPDSDQDDDQYTALDDEG